MEKVFMYPGEWLTANAILFPNPTVTTDFNVKVLPRDFENEIQLTVVDLEGSVIFGRVFIRKVYLVAGKLNLLS